MADQDISSTVDKQYKEGLNYQKIMGFNTKWPEYERFKAGDQWPAATEKTKNLPRPVFNLIRFILNHKISSVANENLKMSFSPEEVPEPEEKPEQTQPIQVETPQPGIPPQPPTPPKPINPELQQAQEGAEKFTKFSDSTWEEIKQDELNEDFLDDAATIGTGILHYYWDDSTSGGITTLYKGDMAGETLDPINVFFGNPQQRKIQKQPYIIISSRDLIESIKAEAKSNKVKAEDLDMISPDKNTTDEGYDSAQKEPTDSQKATVLTKYWKEDGKIWLCKVCSAVVVKPKIDTGFTLYPIVTMAWEKRKKSINGVSEAEGLIPNQKAINFIIAMMLLSVQETAWPKIVAKEGALQQQITNTPGEIIIDYNNQGLDGGIKYMQPGTISQFAPMVVDKIMDFTRTLTGASEVATGDPFTKDLNASAIIALQNAAKIPIDQIKRRFYRAMEDVGRVWEQFYKAKYVTTRNVTVEDDEGNKIPMKFNGSDYKDVPMKLKIDIGASSSFSESLMMQSLDRFLDKQYITFEDYLEYVPNNVVPFKDRLKKVIEQRKAEADALAKQQAEQAKLNPPAPPQAAQPPGMPMDQGMPPQGTAPPQEQQQPLDLQAIMASLTPEELAIVQKHPEVLDQMLQG